MSLEHIPSVNEVVEHVTTAAAVPRPLVVDATRAVIDQYRQSLLADEAAVVSAETLATRVAERLVRELRPPLTPVINATGIIIHTGLGRAPLARVASTTSGRGTAAAVVTCSTTSFTDGICSRDMSQS